MIFYVRWTPFDGKNMEVITRFANVDLEATTETKVAVRIQL